MAEPIRFPGEEETSTGSDDYLVVFLCSLGAFYASLELLNKPVVLAFLRHMWQARRSVKVCFGFLCIMVALGWVALMETIVQRLLPDYFISSWGLIASGIFIFLALGALRLFIRNGKVTANIAAALFLTVLPVEAMHYYLVGGFRKCIPLPVLYGLAPLASILFIRKYLYNLGVFCYRREPAPGCPPIAVSDSCACTGIAYSSSSDCPDVDPLNDCDWAAEFEAYRRLGRSELQRLENLALFYLQRLTGNAFGWEWLFLEDVTVDFIQAVKALPGQPIIADLGAAFGYSSLQILEGTSAHVIANDLSEEHLTDLLSRVPDVQRARLTTKSGDALQLDFSENSLDGILALRWMHFLRPAEIREMFANYSKWLKPGGLLCVTALSPNGAITANGKFQAIYEERVKNGEEWPGTMDRETSCWVKSAVAVEHGYLFDLEVMERECRFAGFDVVKLHYLSHEKALSEKGHVGLLAVNKKMP
ncbi:hypothetical protein BV898_16004 [Hypsibius exemplaris]|uniref:Methyltransferase domain-containing protein n=1 Tax=Hypsibius exemplaris TaxID=2072580 RepID=A0A9X6NCB7_HYPEX|nr:hypothetical protein BV898_16004 [Hypsibius exemplaris]